MRNILGLMLLIFSAVINYCAITSMISSEIIVEWELVRIGSSKIILILIIDFISLRFLSLVRLVAGSVLLYRTSYIRSEHNFSRFIGLVFSFVISIFILILRPNIISLLLGWDGLGVTSYLLVIFYQSKKSYNSGIITALTNRLGDVGILVCVGLIAFIGSWTFRVYVGVGGALGGLMMLIMMIAACTKRAQIPFSSWLPAAMAAPTPVSALIHSSTLVTAGVYLIIRFSYTFSGDVSRSLLFKLGCITMVIAGLAAMGEMDIKKIIALSTLRQLGIIILTLGAGSPKVAFFHLLSHAYFKAILFMCAGRLIHTIREYQDIRTISARESASVRVLAVGSVANLRLSGLPFMTGFYSKDLVLELVLMQRRSIFRVLILGLGTVLTVAYRVRTINLLSRGTAAGGRLNYTSDGDG